MLGLKGHKCVSASHPHRSYPDRGNHHHLQGENSRHSSFGLTTVYRHIRYFIAQIQSIHRSVCHFSSSSSSLSIFILIIVIIRTWSILWPWPPDSDTPTLLLFRQLPLHLLVDLRLLLLCNTKQTLSSSVALSSLSGVGWVFTLDRSRRDRRRQEDHHRHYQQLSVGTINTDQYRSLPYLPRTASVPIKSSRDISHQYIWPKWIQLSSNQ